MPVSGTGRESWSLLKGGKCATMEVCEGPLESVHITLCNSMLREIKENGIF